ncbi:MAG: uroporphyrinogen-III synthase [Planctomyces sp.]|nr:uroporphyrinogen-III synthase [Planctomyces sp.]
MNAPVVCSFESRRAEEMSSLIQRHGGIPLSAPSMREVPIGENPEALAWIRKFIADEYQMLILLTGVGTEALFELAASAGLEQPLREAMIRHTLVIRGPKPAAVLQKFGMRYDLRAPEPNTWRELVAVLDEAANLEAARNTIGQGEVEQRDAEQGQAKKFRLAGTAIAVQEYGIPNPRLYQELSARGATVTPVAVYRWALPEDLSPLENALRKVVAGETSILMFTSANQLASVMQVAERLGLAESFRAAANSQLVASIGPTCSEALSDNGFPVHFEASPPKMGQLVRGAIELWKK